MTAEQIKTLVDKLRGIVGAGKSVEALVLALADLLDSLDHDPVAIKAAANTLRQNAPQIGEACAEEPHATPKVEHPAAPKHSPFKHK